MNPIDQILGELPPNAEEQELAPLQIHSESKCSTIHPGETHDEWYDRTGDIAAENAAGINGPVMILFSTNDA